MSIIEQFIESSTGFSNAIRLIMYENKRLKERVAELEASKGQAKPAQESKKPICDLMQVGEVYCGLRVGAKSGGVIEAPIYFEAGDYGQWVNEPTAMAIYHAEMELRELRGRELRRIVNEYKSETKKSEQK